MSTELLRRTAERILDETGIRIPEYRWPMIESEVCRLGGGDLPRAMARVEGDAALREQFLAAVAIPETHLFRHPGHFGALAELARERHSRGRFCRVLSAGCSTGEEAWSAAAVLASVYLPDTGHFAVEGWDLDPGRLRVATDAHYRSWSVRGGLHGYDRFFHRDGESWRVDERLRPFVRFRQHNLMLAPPEGPLFDAIVFRNVAIYWEPETAARVVEQLSSRLAPDGLFLPGPSDPVRFCSAQWDSSRDDNAAAYRRRGASPTPALPTAPRPVRRPAASPRPRPTSGAAPTVEAPAVPARSGDADWLSRAAVHADAGRYEDALDVLCGRPGPLPGRGRLLVGIVMLNLDRPEEAFAWIRQAVFLEPEDPACRHWLAASHDCLGRSAEAARERRNALELESHDDRVRASA